MIETLKPIQTYRYGKPANEWTVYLPFHVHPEGVVCDSCCVGANTPEEALSIASFVVKYFKGCRIINHK